MGLGDFFRELMNQVSTSQGLADPVSVASLVPGSAEYVSVGPYRLIDDVDAFIREVKERQSAPYQTDFNAVLSADPGAAGLLVLADQHLQVVTSHGVQWDRALTDIAEVVAVFSGVRRGNSPLLACVISTKEGEGVIFKIQMPVRAPDAFSFRTVPRMTNNFCDWDKALAPYGVKNRTTIMSRSSKDGL